MTEKVSIFGLGYVGTVLLGCLARDGHPVIGVDIDSRKLEMIQNGQTPVIEEGMQELIAEAVASGRVEVTDDADEALRRSRISFTCVGTPSLPNGSQDMRAILRLSEQFGKSLREISDYHLFVIRSTVLPGTVEETIRPIIEEYSGKRMGADFGLCFQPEFLREGASIKDYDHPPFTIVGGNSAADIERVGSFFRHLPAEFIATEIKVAEMIKYCCNVFHALKITFANEIGRIAHAFGIDGRQVMELVCQDTQLNISPAYLKPGFAFGGSCLPKDLKGLLYTARTRDVELPMLSHILPSNQLHIEEAARRILQRGIRKLGLVGLSFKGGTDDLRESPLVRLAEWFIGKGIELFIYDPQVNLSRLIGANREYIDRVIPHIASLMNDDPDAIIKDAQAIILGQENPVFMETLYLQGRSDQYILDLVGRADADRIAGEYEGICW